MQITGWCGPTDGAGDGARTSRALGPTPTHYRRGGPALHGLRRSAPRSAGGSTLRGSVKNGSSCATPLSAERSVGASEARDAFVLLLPLFSRGRPGWGLIYLGSGLAGSALAGCCDLPTCRWRGRQGGKRPCPLDPWPLVYADCREGPAFRAALHRPGATRHPWRDAPFCGHPDRAPPPVTPPHGPTDGLEFCG